jgi:hypothetical protein
MIEAIMLKAYLKSMSEIAARGDAREESFYSALEALLQEFPQRTERRHIHITTLPKKTEAGNPDFRVWDGKQHIVGYVEAKAPGFEDLNIIEDTEQLRRYLHTFPNLILTNFYEFRLYRNGELTDKVLVGRPYVAHTLHLVPPVEKTEEFRLLMEKFFSFSLPKVYDAKALAVELAKRTRFLRDEVVSEQLKEEEQTAKGFILGFFEAFKQFLISGLSRETFADLYSQTVTYGLFAARTRAQNGFNRKLAYDYIPQTIGILRDIFQFVSYGKLPREMEWIIDDISEVLSVADVNAILHRYFHEGKGKDPVVHFYETFLAEYDPKIREKRGVYYTPEPVVSYIVRSLHVVLKEKFNRPDGLASESVTLLDPAAGTLTFLAEASRLAVEEFVSKYGEGGKANFIKEHILRDFYAFELMMAPYAVGHLKMSFLLEELGYRLQDDDRFKLYLTNTLEMDVLPETQLPGMASLSEESHLAGKVKKEQPILVILGNPPYSGHSSNVGPWIAKEIKTYHEVDGRPLGEKNPKWLQDDYVKFIRFAQWKIDRAGEGILGFITNHSYLDNPTFRGVRRSLLHTFNEVHVLNLHGNALKKEQSPDGSKDENVFDIRQGVAIVLFTKTKTGKGECVVRHSDLWGLRERKYDWLLHNDIKTTQWRQLSPRSGLYLFVPRQEAAAIDYERYPGVSDIFPVNSVGIVTARDYLTIRWSRQDVWNTVLNFLKLEPEIAREAYRLGKDARDWKVEFAKKDLLENGPDQDRIVPILYRPFDIRYTYYTGRSSGFHCRPRPEVMQHMLHPNLGLISPKQSKETPGAFVTDGIVGHKAVNAYDINYLFPLYLYPAKGNKEKTDRTKHRFGTTMMLFEPTAGYEARQANLSPHLMNQLSARFGKPPAPEEVFYYMYAILYSTIYRERYAEFLKVDFPRIPFTGKGEVFRKMADAGRQLVELHLLRSPALDTPVAKYQGKGSDRIEKVAYDEDQGRVYVNGSQYFDGIADPVWQYRVGGYQVCSKWLKDRKDRLLSLDEIKHYCRIVTSLEETIKTQEAIDRLYPEVEADTLSATL